MLTIISKTGKIVKEVFVLRRYEIKRGTMAGSICNVVRSIQTVKKQEVVHEYQVWTYADGTTTCDCPAHGICCHQDEVSFSEMRRCNTIAPLKVRQVATHAAPVVTPEVVEQTAKAVKITPEQVAEIVPFAQEYREHKADVAAQHQAELDAAKVRPNYRTSAPLNGNRGFQLCKSWAEIEAEKAAKRKVA